MIPVRRRRTEEMATLQVVAQAAEIMLVANLTITVLVDRFLGGHTIPGLKLMSNAIGLFKYISSNHQSVCITIGKNQHVNSAEKVEEENIPDLSIKTAKPKEDEERECKN
ncbi:hypothetical protein V9T40_002374 [Parthenolecanium corni]|uniref:Uncharacterized protein n=1 Tax=Parthenolecanium corni TaxID=536013 RepID=A0AAN9Y3R4_9HEMI